MTSEMLFCLLPFPTKVSFPTFICINISNMISSYQTGKRMLS